jgi:hypothetical protein
LQSQIPRFNQTLESFGVLVGSDLPQSTSVSAPDFGYGGTGLNTQ